MQVYEYKLDGNKKQCAAIEEAIRVVQFIRNKCIRQWMDSKRVSKNDLQASCAVLAKEFPFARRLNSQNPRLLWRGIRIKLSKDEVSGPKRRSLPRSPRERYL